MPSFDAIARTFESATRTISLAGRTVLPVDTNPVPAEWEHITKIDPEEAKKLPLLFPLYLQHTGALEVGGSKDVTGQNTEETLELVSGRPRPAIQEPSGVRQVTERTREMADYFAVPQVLNGDTEAIVGTLGSGIEYLREELGPEYLDDKLPIPLGEGLERRVVSLFSAWTLQEAVFEAYIIMNLDSAAAREASVTEDDLLSPRAAKQRAMVAETVFESEIVYLEYSGTFGGEEAVEILDDVSDALSWSRLWYGGGLDSRENVEAVLEAGADAVVVGNVFHEIADEEADLCADAVEALSADATHGDIESWLSDECDVAETSAAEYLSTIPSLSNPTARAREYLVSTIEAALALDALRSELDGEVTSEAELATALDRRDELPGGIELSNVLGDDEQSFPRDLVAGLLAEDLDLDAEALPVEHISVA